MITETPVPRNAWAVLYRDPLDPDWKTEAIYPSIIIERVNGQNLPDPFDIGEVRACHKARFTRLASDLRYEVVTRFVYHEPFDKNLGKTFTFEWVQ